MITHAIQRGGYVFAYNGSQQLFGKPGELSGYTSSTVSVRRGNYIFVFDIKGNLISSHSSK